MKRSGASDGTIGIHRYVMERSLADVRRAISDGAEVDANDQEGRTPLFYAAMDGDLQIASILIAHGACVSAQDKNLETSLHFAAREYQPELVELLLKNGASVDAQDVHGNSPLWRAVFDSRGRDRVIRLLLSYGADRSLKNKHGVLPEDLARSIRNHDVASYLVN